MGVGFPQLPDGQVTGQAALRKILARGLLITAHTVLNPDIKGRLGIVDHDDVRCSIGVVRRCAGRWLDGCIWVYRVQGLGVSSWRIFQRVHRFVRR